MDAEPRDRDAIFDQLVIALAMARGVSEDVIRVQYGVA